MDVCGPKVILCWNQPTFTCFLFLVMGKWLTEAGRRLDAQQLLVSVAKRRRLHILRKPLQAFAVCLEMTTKCKHFCDLCSFTTQWLSHLCDHKFRHHGKGTLRRCTGCDFVCWTAQEITRHKKATHGVGPFPQWPHRGRLYSRRDSMMQHVRYLHEEFNAGGAKG